jgi:MoxR-like ATPase
MNFIETLKSVDLVLATGEVPLVVGESGIGKTALAKQLSKENNYSLVVIDGNLLKEGEIGGLPTVESYKAIDSNGIEIEKKTTIYAVHNKLREIDIEVENGKEVLLFIDEINRCEHTVQQELMNLILNREINGYKLDDKVKILAAMNPSSKYGSDFDYQVVDMDAAQENRFVWLNMESDYNQWIKWAIDMFFVAMRVRKVLR